MAAAARMSSMRELVQEPTKTTSTLRSVIFWPGTRPMYSTMRVNCVRRSSSVSTEGSGTTPVIGTTASGLVPQVTCGSIVAASSTTSLSKCAPSSEGSVLHHATARSKASPFGAKGRPFT